MYIFIKYKINGLTSNRCEICKMSLHKLIYLKLLQNVFLATGITFLKLQNGRLVEVRMRMF